MRLVAQQTTVTSNRTQFHILFGAAATLSFLLSIYLWFSGAKDQGVFVGLWVPSILSLGIYCQLAFYGGEK